MKHCLISAIAVSVSLLVLPGCSVVQNVTDRFNNMVGKKEQPVVAEKVKPPKKMGTGGTKAVIPDSSTPGTRPTEEELGGGQWNIAAVGDHKIEVEEDIPYVNFQPSTGRFYASDGCNVLNGDYVMRSDGVMTFSNVLSTMKYCPDVEFAPLISAALADGAALASDCNRVGHDTYLYLRDSSGKVQLTLRRHNMEFLNGNWQVASIDGKPVENDECTVFFDISELKIHGNTGCNFFNGKIYIDPARTNSIDFSDMGTTRVACPNAAQESAMLVALESTTTARSGRDGRVAVLLDSEGNELMTLKRIQNENR